MIIDAQGELALAPREGVQYVSVSWAAVEVTLSWRRLQGVCVATALYDKGWQAAGAAP